MAKPEVKALFQLYLESRADDGKPVAASTKSNLNKVLALIPDDIDSETFVGQFGEVFERIRVTNPDSPDSSFRARKSAAAAVARWAYGERLVRKSPDLAERLSMPQGAEFANWGEEPRALTAYKALLAEMAIAGADADGLDERFISRFLDRLPDHMANWRGGWRGFRKRWLALASEGTLPEINIPTPPSKKPSSYKVAEEALPPKLQSELAVIRSRLLGEVLEERLGKKPHDESTADLAVGTVLRLLGFLHHIEEVDLDGLTMEQALALENAKRLIRFTNMRWAERNGEKANSRDIGIGTYEYGQLMQLNTVVRDGLRSEGMARDYAGECRFAKKQIQERREARKNFGHVDEYLNVACSMIEKSRGLPADKTHRVERAMMVRDALIFALLSLFGIRISMFSSIDLRKHVRTGSDASVLLCFRREETKPSIRDLTLELPREIMGLWNEYLGSARAILLGKRRDHEKLLVAQGGTALGPGAIRAMFTRRSEEFLKEERNPHQTRKALVTDFWSWSEGDSMTISCVVDSCPLTMERNYLDLQEQKKIENFDSKTQRAWTEYQEEEEAI